MLRCYVVGSQVIEVLVSVYFLHLLRLHLMAEDGERTQTDTKNFQCQVSLLMAAVGLGLLMSMSI